MSWKYPGEDYDLSKSDDLTPHEMEVLQMCSGTKDWPQQNMAWVNACVEFLYGNGYIDRKLRLTEKGKHVFQ